MRNDGDGKGNDGDDNWRYWPQQSMRTMYTTHYCCRGCCCWFCICDDAVTRYSLPYHYKSDIIQWKFIKLRTNNICIIIYASIHINPLLFNRENQVHTVNVCILFNSACTLHVHVYTCYKGTRNTQAKIALHNSININFTWSFIASSIGSIGPQFLLEGIFVNRIFDRFWK